METIKNAACIFHSLRLLVRLFGRVIIAFLITIVVENMNEN